MFSKKVNGHNFAVAMWASILIGSIISSILYAIILAGPLDSPFMRRYAMGHPVSVVTVYLFFIALTILTHKLWIVSAQKRKIPVSNTTLLDLLQSMPSEVPMEKVRWLDSMWRAQPDAKGESFFGNRLRKLLRLLIQRGSSDDFEKDLQDCADEDAIAQHESYSMVRIVCWAMPMLGFLGTEVGISQTLGNMDMKALATGEQVAMDALTSGLYVAFDTTAVGLVLTMVVMFFQFFVSGIEQKLLRQIDMLMADRCFSILKSTQEVLTDSHSIVQSLAKMIIDGTAAAMNQLLVKQQEMWLAATEKINERWLEVSQTAGTQLTASLQESLTGSLDSFSKGMHKAELASISALDARYQQWQTTLSDQSRNLATYQDELVNQSELLTKLVDNCEGFAALDQTVQQTLGRMTDIDRFHEAAVCMTEAIAVLGIQLERSGQIGKLVRNTPSRKEKLNLFEGGLENHKDAA